MKRTLALLAFVVLTAAVAFGGDTHIQVPLNSIAESRVTGFVNLVQMPQGGSNVHVIAKGLQPGTVYASFYYESSDCTEPADLLGTFTANQAGVGEVSGKIDDDLDEVGSVSVRLGPGYGTLLACAPVHE